MTAASGGAAPFAPIEVLRAHEVVAEQIRRQIALRLIAVGDPLPSERALCTQFGVGRGTVQRAIRLLEAAGLVETRRGRTGGSFVIGPPDQPSADPLLLERLRGDRERVEQALAFRRHVEPGVAELAARGRRAEDVLRLEDLARSLRGTEDDPAYMTYDTELHLAIARAARNVFALEVVERLRVVLNDAIVALPETPPWHRRSSSEHDEVIAAIVRRDAAGAAAAMAAHIRSTERGVRVLLRSL